MAKKYLPINLYVNNLRYDKISDWAYSPLGREAALPGTTPLFALIAPATSQQPADNNDSAIVATKTIRHGANILTEWGKPHRPDRKVLVVSCRATPTPLYSYLLLLLLCNMLISQLSRYPDILAVKPWTLTTRKQ